MTQHLPSNWAEALLSEVTEINPPNPSKVPSESALISFVPMASVEELTGRMDATVAKEWSEVRKGYTRFQEGDVVMAKITPSMENGKAALARGLIGGVGAGTTEFHVFRPREGVAGRFVLHYVLQESFRRQARARMTGTAGQLRVPTQFLEEQQLPLPPTNEQQRIVEAIESYLSRLDAAVASLERVQVKLKEYRASVLKAAVEGRLVPTEAEIARQEGRDYEPAQVLLDRILKERRRRWEESEMARLRKAGKTPKDDKWKAKYEEPAPPDTSRLPELPEGWCWANLGQLKEFSLYGPRFSSDDYTDDGILVLRTSDISEGGRVNLATPPRLRLSPEEYEKYAALRGDLLITRTGSLGTLAVLDDDVRAIPGAYLIQYRLATPLTVVWYCFYFLKSPSAQAELIGSGKGVGRPNLNAPTIEGLPLPLPPIVEQGRIIDEIQRQLSVSDEVSAIVEGNAHRAVRLRQAVLKWAFEGKLVDQDPNDEPAKKLLARIKAERATVAPVKESRSRKAKVAS